MGKTKVVLLVTGIIAIGVVLYFAAQGIMLLVSPVLSFTPG
jgi:hypothetical protein